MTAVARGWESDDRSAMRTVDILIWSIVFGLIYVGIVGILRFVRDDAEMQQGAHVGMLIVQGVLLAAGIFGSYRYLRKFQKRRELLYYGWGKIARDFSGVFLSILSLWLPLRLGMKHLFAIQWLPGQFWMGLTGAIIFVGAIMLIRWLDTWDDDGEDVEE